MSGKGMGMAKPAELNHYPGPLHVIEIKHDIGLNEEQQLKTQQLYASMKSDAIRLGKMIIAEEQHLDELFSTAAITDDLLKSRVHRIAQLRGELRYVHLKTHIQQKAIMSGEQIRRYDHLGGYINHQHQHAH